MKGKKKSKVLFSVGKPTESLICTGNLRDFNRRDGDDAKAEDVIWSYFIYLMKLVGLNGPDKNQEYRKKETDDKTYFVLANILFRTEFKARIEFDKNRIEEGKILRENFALFNSGFKSYEAIDIPEVSFLEVMIGLCQKFDTDVMMTEDETDRSKDWFWLMLKNVNLDIYTDSAFYDPDDEEASPYLICKSILQVINDREYSEDGTGGFFPLKHPKYNQKNRELWLQMHEYFLENLID